MGQPVNIGDVVPRCIKHNPKSGLVEIDFEQEDGARGWTAVTVGMSRVHARVLQQLLNRYLDGQ